MKKMLFLLILMCLFSFPVIAEGFLPLTPFAMDEIPSFEPVALYCGPTQGFYRHSEQAIDLTKPFVCFGQYDCWAMAAQGTPEDFGPVGWIEGGLFTAQSVPELSFEDSYAAMIEEDALITNDPLRSDSVWELSLPRGTQVVVLANYGDFLYVQTEIDGQPARVFIPAHSF